MFATALALLGAIVAVLYVYCKYVLYNYWRSRNIYSPAATVPFGHTLPIVLGKHYPGICFAEMYKDVRRRGLKHMGIYSMTKPLYFPVHPDILKHILVKDFSSFMDRGFAVNEDVDPLTGHLFSLKGQKWKNLRSKLSPTFTSGKMKMMFDIVKTTADQMVTLTDQIHSTGDSFDAKDVFSRYTTDVIGNCAFGLECSSLKNPEDKFRKHGKKVFDPTTLESIKIFYSSTYSKLIKKLKVKLINPDVTDFFLALTTRMVNHRETNNIKRNDFFQILINLKNNQSITDEDMLSSKSSNYEKSELPPSLTIEELAAQAFVFFLAGYETSSSAMTFCLFELAKNQQIQSKLRAEIKSILAESNGQLTYENVLKGSYLDMVVSETLRKYPTLGHLNRRCNKRSAIPDTDLVIEEDNRVIISVYGIHHDPEYYPDPETFDPDRFTEENKAKRPSFTYMPFGEGPRICIGMRFGLMEVKVGLMSILSKYRVELDRRTSDPIVFNVRSFVLCPKNAVYLKLFKD